MGNIKGGKVTGSVTPHERGKGEIQTEARHWARQALLALVSSMGLTGACPAALCPGLRLLYSCESEFSQFWPSPPSPVQGGAASPGFRSRPPAGPLPAPSYWPAPLCPMVSSCLSRLHSFWLCSVEAPLMGGHSLSEQLKLEFVPSLSSSCPHCSPGHSCPECWEGLWSLEASEKICHQNRHLYVIHKRRF